MNNRLAKIGAAAVALMFLGSIVKPNYAFAAGKVNAIVIFVKGPVEVKRRRVRNFTELKLNDMLYAGDTVKTGKRGQASLATKGGAEVRLNQNSSFEITSRGRVRELRLKVGQLWTRMLHRMARLNVRTPSAVCAIRGTEADIEQGDLLTVKVYEGHVDVSNVGGRQSLKAGQMSTVSGAASAPAAPKKMGAGDLGKWQEDANVDLKDIQQSMDKLTTAAGDKKMKIQIQGKDGKTKNVEINLKKK
ncbi:MAG: FecR domain-containing protein [Elusimicrobia bacterium]|nr:FecR domain-containing protein [Elusimicrobiota bacterium]